MAKTIHVNGEALVQGGTGGGSPPALEDIGVSLDGVTITLRGQWDDVYTDTFGPKIPFDRQYFLEDAIIRAEMIFYDQTILNKWLGRFKGATPGTMGQAGALMGANAYFQPLVITSPSDSLLWHFPSSYLVDQFEYKIGTRRTQVDLLFHALPYTGTSGVTTAAVLYKRAYP